MSTTMDLIHMTTEFKPSSSCLVDIYYATYPNLTCQDPKGSFTQCRYFHLGPTMSTSDCFPTGWSPSSGAFISSNACPEGYAVACSSGGLSETKATCCPVGYTCRTNSDLVWYTTDLCYSMIISVQYVYTTSTPGKGPETSTTTGDGSGALNAYGIVIRYLSLSMASITSSSSTTTPEPTTNVGTSSSGLSGGAIAGIVIGCVAAAALVFIAAFLVRKRGEIQRESRASIVSEPKTPAPETTDGNVGTVLSPEQQQLQTPAEQHELSEMSRMLELE
ncbi:uncharacterized protein F4822DRAFT_128927 [Hypoxylon trugodes]|uniref:uncharacterized protein n=1 Tax=Hypoxylon trugodes TaxID=326681 RepID=UPI00218F16B9|nr:uncharacterized protein F4822DRAFT_128927 [Hypoxylon trugodes]KAI1392416.1 hypothetical protein F4822DRAFT_128927 [Hypoxylon trugodes]